MREYRFTVTEHDRDRPWIVGGSEHRTVELLEGASFFKWAAEHYPQDRFTVELGPWQLSNRDAH